MELLYRLANDVVFAFSYCTRSFAGKTSFSPTKPVFPKVDGVPEKISQKSDHSQSWLVLDI